MSLLLDDGSTSPGSLLAALGRKLRSAAYLARRAAITQRIGFHPSTIYDQSFYLGPGCTQGREHAPTIARVLQEMLAPHGVFDFGCGSGDLLRALADRGIEAAGCEASVHGVRMCDPRTLVFQADLRKPVLLNRRYDLAVCVEVAEHLPRRAERTLVASVAAAASRWILFSASPPGDLGDDHINLRPPEHWASLFAERGWKYEHAEALQIRAAIAESGGPAWYKNTLVFRPLTGQTPNH